MSLTHRRVGDVTAAAIVGLCLLHQTGCPPAFDVASLADCNQNGVPDELEIESRALADDNLNDVPDVCEPDVVAPRRGDLMRDGFVDGDDIQAFVTCTAGLSDPLECGFADMDGDCDVDASDRDLFVGALLTGALIEVADADHDGVPDACDLCPDDASKAEPGACGCGVPDSDSDGDGVLDCIEGPPAAQDIPPTGDCSGVIDREALRVALSLIWRAPLCGCGLAAAVAGMLVGLVGMKRMVRRPRHGRR